MPFNVWLLTLAQAFAMSATPMMMLLGGLIGADIAPSPEMATLPIASMVIGLALSVLPVSRLMQRFGRKPVFVAGALLGACSGLVAAFATSQQNFVLFCFGAVMLGGAGAVVQQYRFAAMESVAEPFIAKAASRVLLGGLVAAIIGPELAVWGVKLWPQAYVGAFFCLTLVSLIAAVILSFYRESELERDASARRVQDKPRPLSEVLTQSQLWVAVAGATLGYAMMSFVMTATPLHMHHIEHYSLADTKWVIQSHIIAMYLPSLFSGVLVSRLGVSKMMLLGLLAYLVTIVSAIIGRDLLNYWAALVLLGIGWNFLFVAGTSLLPRCYEKCERYKVQSFNDSLVFGAQAMASLSAGWVIHLLGWNRLLLSCLPLIGAQVLLISWWKWSRLRQASKL